MKRIVLFLVSAAVLLFGVSAPAQAAPKSIKLKKAQFKNVGPYQCGQVKGAWVPGINTKSTKTAKYFIPFTAYAADEAKKAKKVKGKSKSAIKKRAAFEKKAADFTARANQQAATCASGVYATPGFTPATPYTPINMNQAPIRIDITNSKGLAKATGSVGSFASVSPRLFSGDADSVSPRAVASGDSLVSVMSNGTLRDSITSGTLNIQNFIVADNGKAYISTWGVQLDGNWNSDRCVLIEVSRTSDIPTCIQSNPNMGSQSNFQMQWFGSYQNNYNPSVQTDAAGAVYYSGYSNGSAALRKYSNGVITPLISDNVSINDFVVLPNGNVVVYGYTSSTSTSWIKLFYANGGLRSIEPSAGSNFLRRFSDGNIYYAPHSNSEIRVFDTNTLNRRTTPWFGGTTPTNDESVSCAPNACGSLTSPRSLVQLTDNSVYALTERYVNNQSVGGISKMYPQVSGIAPGQVSNAKIIGAAGAKVAIAGLDSNGFQTLEIFDPNLTAHTTILDGTNEIEIGAMSYRASDNQLIFSGLRFSDNRTVVGTVNLTNNSVSIGIATSSKLYDLQAFG
jgi:hypothetical protein